MAKTDATEKAALILSSAQHRDLALIAQGYTRGESATTCEALCRRRLIAGDWMCGYDITERGAATLKAGV